MRDEYASQVRLLIRLLPFAGAETDFALKGGTAINLFYRNMPRYSVDIDLIYVPIQNRDDSLKAIANALTRITDQINRTQRDVKASLRQGGDNQETRIIARTEGATVKIEVSPVMRGTLFPPKLMNICSTLEEHFGFAEMGVVEFNELFAGKIIAALDRAHPRDLFDVHHLLINEGISDELFKTTMIYLISSKRPMHELLDPGPIYLDDIYRREFEGMATEMLSLEILKQAHSRLITELKQRLTGNTAAFLESVHQGTPDFNLIGFPKAAALPAVQWKLVNLEKFKQEQPKRHANQLAALRNLFVQ